MPSVGVRQNVLGVSWDVITDEFYFNVDVSDARCTKRKMLSVTNSLYDPLWFVTPVVLKARLLYSEACKQKVSWDEPIAGSIQSKWKAWINGLPSLVNVRINAGMIAPHLFNYISFRMRRHLLEELYATFVLSPKIQ